MPYLEHVLQASQLLDPGPPILFGAIHEYFPLVWNSKGLSRVNTISLNPVNQLVILIKTEFTDHFLSVRSQNLHRWGRADAAHPKLGRETPSFDAALKVREFWRPALVLNSSAQTLVRFDYCRRPSSGRASGTERRLPGEGGAPGRYSDWGPMRSKGTRSKPSAQAGESLRKVKRPTSSQRGSATRECASAP